MKNITLNIAEENANIQFIGEDNSFIEGWGGNVHCEGGSSSG